MCHSDLHLIDNDWGVTQYPLVAGHEIVGHIVDKGSAISNLQVGQRVGVGWQCGACMQCEWCIAGEENFCSSNQLTAVKHHGGFAEFVRASSRFVIPIPDTLSSETAAPLFCAGITVYTALEYYHLTPAMHVGVVGIGSNACRTDLTLFSSAFQMRGND